MTACTEPYNDRPARNTGNSRTQDKHPEYVDSAVDRPPTTERFDRLAPEH